MSLKIGIQLYSVRDAMAKDPVEAIKTVTGIGYRYLEFANHNAEKDFGVGFGIGADKLKEALEGTGAQFVSGHITPFNESNFKEVVRYNLSIGSKYICNPADFFQDRDDVLRKCEGYNKIGRMCHEEGLSFLYHNHFHEFQEFGGKTVLQLIAENTDSKFLGFEVDTFWVMRGGHCPKDVMKELGTRVKLVHQKDFSKDTKSPKNLFDVVDGSKPITMETFIQIMSPDMFTEIGTGTMDIQGILDVANGLGSVDYVILEQDMTSYDQIESVRISMDSFKKYSGIEFM